MALNLPYLIPTAVVGVETYGVSLLRSLAAFDSETDLFGALPANFHSVPCPVPATLRAARIAWEHVVLPVQVRKRSIDVLHLPNTVAPMFVRCPSVVTFCDIL